MKEMYKDDPDFDVDELDDEELLDDNYFALEEEFSGQSARRIKRAADVSKKTGTGFFKKQKWEDALEHWKRALSLIKLVQGRGSQNSKIYMKSGMSKEEQEHSNRLDKEEVDLFQINMQNNLSLCYTKMERYNDAIGHA